MLGVKIQILHLNYVCVSQNPYVSHGKCVTPTLQMRKVRLRKTRQLAPGLIANRHNSKSRKAHERERKRSVCCVIRICALAEAQT